MFFFHIWNLQATLSLDKSDVKKNIVIYFRNKSSLPYFPPVLGLSPYLMQVSLNLKFPVKTLMEPVLLSQTVHLLQDIQKPIFTLSLQVTTHANHLGHHKIIQQCTLFSF